MRTLKFAALWCCAAVVAWYLLHGRAEVAIRDANSGNGIKFVATSRTDLEPHALNLRSVSTTEEMVRSTQGPSQYFARGDPQKAERARRRGGEVPLKKLLVRGSEVTTKPLHAPNGLTSAILAAYNGHRDLQLRPDDVWITILAQFSAYVNARAEKLRSKFVEHEGKIELEVVDIGTIYTADFGKMTRRMLDKITENIKDASLREWFLPGFTTSTPTDDICAAASTMAAMQAYFDFRFTLACGIPHVTLLGTIDDWIKLRQKIDRLLDFEVDDDKPLAQWVRLLSIICDNFVVSAKSGSTENLHFWDTVALEIPAGSGSKDLSGWITTFSFFDKDGNKTPTRTPERAKTKCGDAEPPWLVMDSAALNTNVVSCPVKIDDNGVEYDSRLFVGQMAFDVDETASLVAPRNDWALVIDLESSDSPTALGL